MASKTLSTHVALLRGINVGGKNKLPMKDLAAMFVHAGCVDVQTYIQSGNVICKAPAAVSKQLSSTIAAAILERTGLRVPVVMRAASEIESVARNNPFLKAGKDPASLHVAFLHDVPKPARASALDLRRSPPDEIVLAGRDLYMLLPNGVAPSKFTNAYLDATLDTTSTMRNWRTVLTLLELAGL